MPRPLLLCVLLCICLGASQAQDLSGIEVHGFATQGFLYSSHNNYLTMNSSSGSLQWTDGAISINDSLSDNLRVGIQLHMYQLGQLGGPNLEVDWVSGDYRANDYFGVRAGKVKTPFGLFNDSQDVDAVFLWILLPQSAYPIDNKSYNLAHLGGEVYGGLPLGNHAGKLHYRAYTGYNSLDLNGGYVKLAADEGVVFTTAPGGSVYGIDLRWETPLTGLTLGSSADHEPLNGPTTTGSIRVTPSFEGADYAQFQRRGFYFAGEYRRQPATFTLTFGPVTSSSSEDQRIWFVMGSYRLAKNIHAGSYYSHYLNAGTNTTQVGSYSKDWVVSGRYDFNAYFYGKIEGHFLHGTALGDYQDINPNGLQPNSNMLAAKIGFSF